MRPVACRRLTYKNPISTMKNKTHFCLLLSLGLLAFGCQPKETTFSYGKDGVLYPGTEEKAATPAFQNGGGEGNYSSYPVGLVMDAKTGEVNVEKSNPGYEYLVRYVAADGRTVAHTFITIAGIKYPSRFFDLTNKQDFTVQPVVAGGTLANASFEITASEVIPNNGGTANTRQQSVTGALPDTTIRAVFNGTSGTIDLRQLIGGVFGLNSGRSGSIDLTIAYKATIGGKNVNAQTRCVLRRESIISPTYRRILRNFANFDKVIAAKQQELRRENETAKGSNEKTIGPIRIEPSWGLGYSYYESLQGNVFRFTHANQDPPPPMPAEAMM